MGCRMEVCLVSDIFPQHVDLDPQGAGGCCDKICIKVLHSFLMGALSLGLTQTIKHQKASVQTLGRGDSSWDGNDRTWARNEILTIAGSCLGRDLCQTLFQVYQELESKLEQSYARS